MFTIAEAQVSAYRSSSDTTPSRRAPTCPVALRRACSACDLVTHQTETNPIGRMGDITATSQPRPHHKRLLSFARPLLRRFGPRKNANFRLRCMEVSALIPLADPPPALVVARRWASAAPGASLESARAYWDRVEWAACRSPHVSSHVRCAARDYPVRSLRISRSIVSSL